MLHKGLDPLPVTLQGAVSLYHWHVPDIAVVERQVFVEINEKENSARPLKSNAKMPQLVGYNISQNVSFLSSLPKFLALHVMPAMPDLSIYLSRITSHIAVPSGLFGVKFWIKIHKPIYFG